MIIILVGGLLVRASRLIRDESELSRYFATFSTVLMVGSSWPRGELSGDAAVDRLPGIFVDVVVSLSYVFST